MKKREGIRRGAREAVRRLSAVILDDDRDAEPLADTDRLGEIRHGLCPGPHAGGNPDHDTSGRYPAGTRHGDLERPSPPGLGARQRDLELALRRKAASARAGKKGI